MLRVLLWIVAVIVILILICFVYHRYRLNAEKKLREPLGQLVDINGNNMSIYVEGSGSRTLVFLSGSGTCSPILDFKSLYSLLRDDYRIVVVEKFGYGYSDIVDEDRNIQTILSETRLALNKAGIDGTYVLCPHSMSGIEALYWAQKYPDEIEAIIGLDMAVPEYYENMKINLALMKLGQYAADLGITRLIPTLAESDAIKHGTLTNDEKNRYRAIFYNRTATVTMINEAKSVKDNARIVAQNGVPQVPMLLFISGIEALYWAQKYPDEIEAIIGLDMAVPEYYENMKINLALMKLGQYAADLGITRLIPTLAESDAIKHGTLTNDEKNRYRAIFYNRTATVTMINEAKSVKDNARIVAQNGVPQVPMLLFISDGTGGTGFDKETWRRIQEKYISEVESGKYIELDCPHYVHDYEYGRISEEIKSFLSD